MENFGLDVLDVLTRVLLFQTTYHLHLDFDSLNEKPVLNSRLLWQVNFRPQLEATFSALACGVQPSTSRTLSALFVGPPSRVLRGSTITRSSWSV
jgi:hypothetical protein